jgi:hypothetical protein
MTRDDAVTIVAMIVHGWPGAPWEQERMESYVQDLMPLDAEITTHALARARNTLKYRPSIAELKEFIQLVRRERAAAKPPQPVDEVQFAKAIPAFVRRWVVARFLVSPPDMRPFPEQHPFSGGTLPVGADEWMPEEAYVEEAKRVTDQQVWAAVKGSRATDDDAIVTA